MWRSEGLSHGKHSKFTGRTESMTYILAIVRSSVPEGRSSQPLLATCFTEGCDQRPQIPDWRGKGRIGEQEWLQRLLFVENHLFSTLLLGCGILMPFLTVS